MSAMKSRLFVVVALGLLACKSNSKTETADTAPDTDSPYTHRDTSAWVDTSIPVETADSAIQDTAPQDTGDTGIDEPTVDEIALYPDGLTVFTAASYGLRLNASVDGSVVAADLELATFASSDEAVATVDTSGVVTAVGPGTVTLSADYEGQAADVTLTVTEPGTLTVHVEDYETGEPVTEDVWIFGSTFEISGADEAGLITATLKEAGAVDITAAAEGYVAVTLHGTISRDVTIRMRTVESVEAADVALTGDIDFSKLTAGGVTDLEVGLAAASFYSHPLVYNPEALMSEDRTISIFGIEATLPANLYVADYAETWEGHANAGDFGVWTMAGPVAIADLTSGLNGSSDALALFVDNLSNFSYGWEGGLTGASGDEVAVDLAPSASFDEAVVVTVPDLPNGFYGTEDVLVILLEDTWTDGYATVGMGTGQGEVVAMRVASSAFKESYGSYALALAQVGGLGSGGAIAYSLAAVSDGVATLPEFQEPPVFENWDAETHDFALTSSDDVTMQHLFVACGDGNYREGVMAGGVQKSATLPHLRDAMTCSYGRTNWTIWSYELSRGTFEGFATDGDFRASDVEASIERTTRVQTSL